MRFRHATLAIAALTVFGAGACSDDPEVATPAATPGASVPASAGAAALGEPGASASPGTPPTEGTSTAKPPKKSGGGSKARQGPAGKPAGSPDVLTAAGVGPYSIGVAQGELKTAGLVGKVTTKKTCGAAKGLSKYHSPDLAFTSGRLQRLTVTSTDIATPTGAKVGTTYASLKGMYPAGKQLDDWVGASAWYTLDGGNALLFRIKDDKVASIDAGAGSTLQFFYTDKQGC
jgi:hypothetical protein